VSYANKLKFFGNDGGIYLKMADTLKIFTALKEYLLEQIIGQENLINNLLIAVLSDGHLLVEGAPGLAKTKAIKMLASMVEGSDHRIQFTPDLLPVDLTGSDIYRPETGEFVFNPGPLFNNFILADEINRAPAKVQSALLEAMAERQITVGKNTYKLPELFLVMATQNPIEQEGTYSLPEAQLDRFLMFVKVGYPDKKSEHEILKVVRQEENGVHQNPGKKITQKIIEQARNEVLQVNLAQSLEDYLIELVMATRDPAHYDKSLVGKIAYGSSPRGTIALDRCSRAAAWLQGRDFVTPYDIHFVVYNVLRHRIILNFEAQSEGLTTDEVIKKILAYVPVP